MPGLENFARAAVCNLIVPPILPHRYSRRVVRVVYNLNVFTDFKLLWYVLSLFQGERELSPAFGLHADSNRTNPIDLVTHSHAQDITARRLDTPASQGSFPFSVERLPAYFPKLIPLRCGLERFWA
jgi:hypothetical protein